MYGCCTYVQGEGMLDLGSVCTGENGTSYVTSFKKKSGVGGVKVLSVEKKQSRWKEAYSQRKYIWS